MWHLPPVDRKICSRAAIGLAVALRMFEWSVGETELMRVLSAAPGLVLVIAGIMQAIVAQVGAAVVDTAKNTSSTVELLEQAKQSRTSVDLG